MDTRLLANAEAGITDEQALISECKADVQKRNEQAVKDFLHGHSPRLPFYTFRLGLANLLPALSLLIVNASINTSIFMRTMPDGLAACLVVISGATTYVFRANGPFGLGKYIDRLMGMSPIELRAEHKRVIAGLSDTNTDDKQDWLDDLELVHAALEARNQFAEDETKDSCLKASNEHPRNNALRLGYYIPVLLSMAALYISSIAMYRKEWKPRDSDAQWLNDLLTFGLGIGGWLVGIVMASIPIEHPPIVLTDYNPDTKCHEPKGVNRELLISCGRITTNDSPAKERREPFSKLAQKPSHVACHRL